MKTRSIKDIFLPPRIAYHVKIVLGSLLFVLFYGMIFAGSLWNEGSIHMLLLLIIQLEFYLWLGRKFFDIDYPHSIGQLVRKAIIRLIMFYLVAFILSAIFYVGYMTLIYIINGWDLGELIPNILGKEVKGFLIGASSGYVVGSIIFFYFQWIDALKREQKLREEKLIFQYETLKSQVNPHFLFNSLNTLSSLVYKDPAQSDEFIRRLSSIYRYILDNMDAELVDLERETQIVKDYFYLQQVRDNGKIDLEIKMAKPEDFQIMPISLQMLMENALKHNAATREQPLRISIILDQERSIIVCRNNLQPKQQIEMSSKKGLKNLNERVKLMLHKEIFIRSTGSEFIVEVPVKVKEHEHTDH